MMIIFILLSMVFLAYSNGANDNFKGVATLFGSGTADYKKALAWATITTLLGSIAAIFVAAKLVVAFSGKGLVPEAIIKDTHFVIAVGMGAAATVFIASLTGIPISTTHGLTGALIGAGLVAAGPAINLNTLGRNFFIPLIFSPVISVLLTLIIYPLFKSVRLSLGVERQMCLCIGKKAEPVYVQPDGAVILKSSGLAIAFDQVENCRQFYSGKILGFDAQAVLDKLHFISAGAVSFARGLNDTPKIVALLLVVSSFSLRFGVIIAATAMTIGGLLNAKKVAQTMSQRITKMNHGQGFSANIVTAFLVIFASKWGLPVSTTHVSCGSLFGIGLVNKKADPTVIKQIISAWVLTLPIAAIFAGVCYFIFQRMGV